LGNDPVQIFSIINAGTLSTWIIAQTSTGFCLISPIVIYMLDAADKEIIIK